MAVLAVDIGASWAKLALINELGKLYKLYKIPTGFYSEPDRVLKLIKERSMDKPLALAIAGTVAGGKVYDNPNLLKWRGLDLGKRFKGVLIENDANASAFGEWFWKERNTEVLVSLTLGSGVGSGVVINGKIYKGSRGLASELGHMVIDYNGEKCVCGNRGCLETLCSAKFIKKRGEEIFGREYEPEALSKLAKRGDRKASRIFRELGTNLGVGISNIANIFNPDLVVLAGGISNSFELFSKSLRESFRERTLKGLRKVRIKRSSYGDLAGVFGIAAIYFSSRKPTKD